MLFGRSCSLAFRQVVALAERIAPTNATVLICGASGTGKELMARLIHARSSRARSAFVAINCAAVPGQLFESELFGYAKGAFTGADRDSPGRFAAADGGTLFLDEVGETPAESQAKLLRALENGSLQRLGDQLERPVDLRIVAATNLKLEDRVLQGKFRMDLYHRLNVVVIRLPALCERPEDIEPLLRAFANEFGVLHALCVTPLPDDVAKSATRHEWPGNVRELRNYAERSIVTGRWDPLPIRSGSASTAADRDAGIKSLESVERDHILHVLALTRGVIAGENGAAQLLGLHPNTLRSRMGRLRIEKGGFMTACVGSV